MIAGGGSLGQVEARFEDAILGPPFTVRGQVIRPDRTAVEAAIVDVFSFENGTEVMVRAGRSGEWSAEVASGCVAPSARHRGQCGNVSEPGEPDGCDDGRPLEIGGEPGSTVVAAPIVLEHWHHAQGPDGVTTPPPGRCIDLPYRSMVARVDLEMGNPTAIRVAPASE